MSQPQGDPVHLNVPPPKTKTPYIIGWDEFYVTT